MGGFSVHLGEAGSRAKPRREGQLALAERCSGRERPQLSHAQGVVHEIGKRDRGADVLQSDRAQVLRFETVLDQGEHRFDAHPGAARWPLLARASSRISPLSPISLSWVSASSKAQCAPYVAGKPPRTA